MKGILLIALFCVTAHASAQTKSDNHPAAPAPKAVAVMPADYAKQIDTLQEQSKKLDKDYEQVITLFKEYSAKRDQIQAEAAVLITRAALAAHLTIEQLDNSDLVKDEKGNWEWREKAKAAPVVAQPEKKP